MRAKPAFQLILIAVFAGFVGLFAIAFGTVPNAQEVAALAGAAGVAVLPAAMLRRYVNTRTRRRRSTPAPLVERRQTSDPVAEALERMLLQSIEGEIEKKGRPDA